MYLSINDTSIEEITMSEATYIIKKLINKNTKYNKEINIITKIKRNITDNDLIMTRADISNATVIINKREYIHKTKDFLNNNNCILLNKDPSEKYLRETNKIVKTAKMIFDNKNLNVYIKHNTKNE